MHGTNDLEKALSNVVAVVREIFDSDRAWLGYPCDPHAANWRVVMEHTRPEFPGAFALGADLPVDPEFAAVLEAARAGKVLRYGPDYELEVPRQAAQRFGVRSQMIMAVSPRVDKPYLLGLHQCSHARVWTADEARLFEELAWRLADALTSLLTFRDLMQAQAQLRASEARYRTLVDHATDGLLLHDERMTIIDVNNQACQSLGYDRDELIGLTPRHIDAFMDAASVARLEARVAAGETVTFESVHRRKDGTLFPVEIRGREFEQEDKRFRLCLVRDISDRKRAEEELSEVKERFRVLSESSLTGIYLIEEGRFRYVNPAMARMFGYGVGEMVDLLGPADLVHPDDRATVAENIRRRLDREIQEVRYRFRGLRKDGSVFPVEVHGRRIDHHGKVGVMGTLIDNTERQRVEDDLRASEARFRALVDHATDALFLMGEGSVVVDANRQACESLGYRPEELIGMYPRDFDAGLDEVSIASIAERVRAGETVTFETRHRRKDGSVFPVEIRSRQFQLDGKWLRLALVRDITDRKRAEERTLTQYTVARILADAVTLDDAVPRILQAICEHLDWDLGALWRVDTDARVLRCDRVWRRPSLLATQFEAASRNAVFGSGAGLPGRVWASRIAMCIADVAQEPGFARRTAAVGDGLHAAFAFPILLGGEVLGVIEFLSREVREPEEELLDMMAALGSQIGQLIERKDAEERILNTTKLMERVMASISDYLWSSEVDEHGTWKYLYYSPVVEKVTGRPPSYYTEDPSRWLETVHPDDRPLCIAAFHRLASGQSEHEEGDYRVVLPDGKVRWVRDSATLTRLGPGRFRIDGVVSDISERKAAEEALQRAQLQLVHMNRVITTAELVTSIAHEVNQPLGAIVASVGPCMRWLSARPPDLESAMAALERIANDGERASNIINRIRSLVKRESPRRQQVDVNAVLRDVIALIRDQLRRNDIALRTELNQGLKPILGDRIQLEQVILNLIANAIDAAGTTSDRTRRQIVVATEEGVEEVIVEVRDSGHGFDPDRAEQLFEPFYTTKDKGLGMGLWISRSIIEAHGGRLWATSLQPHGASFRFSLPIETPGSEIR